MADQFRLSGGYGTSPATGAQASGDPQIDANLDERLSLGNKTSFTVSLAADDVSTVDLCGMTNIHVLVLRTVGGKVRARITSADGSTQSVPVDPLLIFISKSVPITALDLTRVAGVPTTVKVFFGERPT